MKNKKCSKCGEEKLATTENFTKSSRTKDGLHPQCKVCKNETCRKQIAKWRENPEWVERQRQQVKKHRETGVNSRRERALSRKIEFVEMKGGCCQKCGYNKNLGALDFHHTDPESRSVSINMVTMAKANNQEQLLAELEKCELLCANCHREEHHPQLILEDLQLRS